MAEEQPSGWQLRKYGGPRLDRTAEYRGIVNAARSGVREIDPLAKEFVYLFVPGLLTEHYGDAYARSNIARLKELGLDCRMVEIDTDAAVKTNATTIRDTILAIAPRRVIGIGHSKGGVDFTAALALHPELYEYVYGFIALQVPFGGSYVAEYIVSSNVLFAIARKIVESVFKARGSGKCFTDLTYDQRKEFLKKNMYDVNRVPTISFVSTIDKGVMGPLAKYLHTKHGTMSDGMVPDQDGQIPGSDLVVVDGVDHGGAVMLLGSKDADQPADITQALVVMILRRAAEVAAERELEHGKGGKKDKKDKKKEKKDKKGGDSGGDDDDGDDDDKKKKKKK